MKKRILCLLACIMMAMTLMVGCGGNGDSGTASTDGALSAETVSVLNEFEDIVNRKIDILEAMLDDPTDASVLGDFADISAEFAAFEDRINDLEDELEDEELDEFYEVIDRIFERLEDLMNQL